MKENIADMLLQPETMHQLVLLAVATRRIIIGEGISAVCKHSI